jgi:hypothetical protein
MDMTQVSYFNNGIYTKSQLVVVPALIGCC